MKTTRHRITSETARAFVASAVMELPADGTVTVSIGPSKRSNMQNDMFHALVRAVSDTTGYGINALKRYFCSEFGRIDYEIGPQGMTEHVLGSSDLNRDEFTRLIDGVMQWCVEQGITLPAPAYLEKRQ